MWLCFCHMQPPTWFTKYHQGPWYSFCLGDNYEFPGGTRWLELETSSVLKTWEELPSMAVLVLFRLIERWQPLPKRPECFTQTFCLGRESFFK